MRIEFLLLEDVIKKHSGLIYYMANPRNWGDGLIRWASLRFFKEINLQVHVFSPADVSQLNAAPSGLVIYGRGGAWC